MTALFKTDPAASRCRGTKPCIRPPLTWPNLTPPPPPPAQHLTPQRESPTPNLTPLLSPMWSPSPLQAQWPSPPPRPGQWSARLFSPHRLAVPPPPQPQPVPVLAVLEHRISLCFRAYAGQKWVWLIHIFIPILSVLTILTLLLNPTCLLLFYLAIIFYHRKLRHLISFTFVINCRVNEFRFRFWFHKKVPLKLISHYIHTLFRKDYTKSSFLWTSV